MRRVVFVDLDDTLFQSQRKNPHATQLAAVDRDGKPLSYRCDRQEAFFNWLAQDAVVVPVTGRSVDAFRRVSLPLGQRAICSFGGVILDEDGTPEPQWHDQIAQAAAQSAPLMLDLLATVKTTAQAEAVDVRYRIIEDAALPLYISVKHNGGLGPETTRLAEAVAPAVPDDWTLHLNGNNMALLPPFLGKAAAVRFFLQRFADSGPIMTVGVGDSLTDVGFMGLCDYAIAPSRSQILATLAQHQPLTATATATATGAIL
jgi:hydroxymethylpyrimidine pyrophosphatase-like HAD family hydrolase